MVRKTRPNRTVWTTEKNNKDKYTRKNRRGRLNGQKEM